MFCGLGEERTRFRKKKKEKKKREQEKNFKVVNSGLVEMKGYLKTYNRVKYCLTYLSRF